MFFCFLLCTWISATTASRFETKIFFNLDRHTLPDISPFLGQGFVLVQLQAFDSLFNPFFLPQCNTRCRNGLAFFVKCK